MNESDFENRLRVLQPAEPSPDLEQRIALALETSLVRVPATALLRRPAARGAARSWVSLLQGFGWAAAGALAGVAGMAYLQPSSPSARPAAAVAAASAPVSLFEPSESAREVVSSAEEETVYNEGSEPARLVRSTSIERHAWTNPATGAWVQVEFPREDLVALPISYQ